MRIINETQSALVLTTVLLSLALAYGEWRAYEDRQDLSQTNATLRAEIAKLEQEITSNTLALEGRLIEAQSSLVHAIAQESAARQNELGTVSARVGSISGSVNTLEKLTKTDPELLQKYSKVFFLNEHYEPPRLIEVPDTYEYDEDRHHKVHASVWPYLQNMLNAAKSAGKELYVYSAYRPFEEQRALKGIYSTTYGEGTANQFSADQGYSEHQLGTAVDLITTGINGTLDGFGATDEYDWLKANAYRYGFILSYPEGNESYIFEPWHWRFVGVALATHLRNTGQNFYDLSQREIDEYLVSVFD